ncbi:MAG: FAD-dependent thymidylate synthase [bacterium]
MIKIKIIKPSYEIITPKEHIENMLQRIEKAGRTCYKSENKITKNSASKFVKKIVKRRHLSVIEHESISVKIICDRGVSHEAIRHRLCSFSQESSRFCDYNKDKFNNQITFIQPCWFENDYTQYDCNELNRLITSPLDKDESKWLWVLFTSESEYQSLRESGWKPEQARSVLPNSLKTELVMTANLREWLHIFKLRTAKASHPQMREIMIPLCKEFQKLLPEIYGGINEA